MRRQPIDLTERQQKQFIEMHGQPDRYSNKSIAERFGMHEANVSKLAKKYGLEPRPHGSQSRSFPEAT